jgi:rubrerythrin
MEKETTLTSGHSKRLGQIRKSVRFIRPQRRIIMAITIPKECSICGTLYNRVEHEECPHCEDNEFDPYSVFQDVDKD